jgi:site-specific DNA recombinase
MGQCSSCRRSGSGCAPARLLSRAYEKYATGDWTTSMIRDEFNRLGVTTRRRPNKPERPISNSHVNAILRNRYYVGVVRYEGVEYPGSHELLISEALFDQVQRVREARHTSREKPRVWSQYLKGSVYCGQCGEPLSFAKSRNRTGKIYDFFYCLGRQNMKNGCTFRAIQVHQLEDLVAEHWRTVTLREEHISQIRQIVLDHIATVLPKRAVVRQSAEATLASVDAASKKLLDAFYADAIDTHELKTEQLRLAAQRAKVQAEIEKHEVSEHHLRERVENCLALLDNAHAHYLAADEISRKELNQAVFAHLYVDDDEIVASDLKPAFQRLLSGTTGSRSEDRTEEGAERPDLNQELLDRPEVTESTDRGQAEGHHDLPPRARRTAAHGPSRGIPRPGTPQRSTPLGKTQPRPSKGPRLGSNYFGSGGRI